MKFLFSIIFSLLPIILMSQSNQELLNRIIQLENKGTNLENQLNSTSTKELGNSLSQYSKNCDAWKRMKKDMSKQSILSLLGEPISEKKWSDNTKWKYKDGSVTFGRDQEVQSYFGPECPR